ncbi:jmjC domain-containing histone demethylation protein 1 [Eurytemora carolleeae]|uniref:jmjC domain-containing histone demethylation protein 1 n=1 Tax=Eurytemora carolleeae TaxID=1294199 RepID=UPI000C775E2B|nr:jmjC domain-containing histone demethylation protein 1 [Eurytemora carolleeae]|eukprot:XP_023336351.1 jmjC domain-containing histone demethylation protein 1-like [Eurytemora affinis]
MANTRSKPKRINDIINWETVDDVDKECGESRGFLLRDVLNTDKFEDTKETMIEELTGEDLTVAYMQKSGFIKPILVKQRDNLGLTIPPEFHSREFGVESIRSYIGSRRIVDALDTKTQKTKSMTMRQWCSFWITFPRKQILNGISLEFSLTKLDAQIISPKIVRQIDWTEKAWPRHLKEMQKEYTNNLDEMMYPKVQKFVIMSVASSYMDFHIDFGGTSVWYYLLRGLKIFWLIPPTDKNLNLYKAWVRGEVDAKFFGDIAEGCCRLDLVSGNTLFIPSGWIHAVYSVKDAIAFSGSFLHSFSIENQLKVNYVEESLRVLNSHRFPFFTEMLWYVLDRYVSCLTGNSCLDLPEDEKKRMRLERGDHIDPNKEFLYPGLVGEAPKPPLKHVHLTQEEIRGLKFIVMFLAKTPAEKRCVPDIIPEPGRLVKCVRDIIKEHEDDCPEAAVTGTYILRWTKKDDVDTDIRKSKLIPKPKRKVKSCKNPFAKNHVKALKHMRSREDKPAEIVKKRRRRCMECEGCIATDCKSCPPCRDMVKYGGMGRMRQSCVKRHCARPLLPVAAQCSVCQLDGWNQTPDPKKIVDLTSSPPDLFECIQCFDILHPKCATTQGQAESTLSNSWTCSNCLKPPDQVKAET